MTSKELDKAYQENKEQFHSYINLIKQKSPWDIFTIINPTLVKNPYVSEFTKNYFLSKVKNENKVYNFLKHTFKFYVKQFYSLFSYAIATILYKLYYKKKRQNDVKVIIDTFGLVDKANKEGVFSENYLTGIYELFEKYDTKYAILLRPYQVAKNPFKLNKI